MQVANAFNHPNYNPPSNLTLGVPAFGQLTVPAKRRRCRTAPDPVDRAHHVLRLLHLSRLRLAILLLGIASLSPAQTKNHGVVRPLSEVKFEPDDDVKCLASTVETGDPAKGPSTIILKAPPNCLVPWHYHTAAEQLIVTRGKRPDGDGGHACPCAWSRGICQ